MVESSSRRMGAASSRPPRAHGLLTPVAQPGGSGGRHPGLSWDWNTFYFRGTAMYDLIIRNGTVVDGTGADARRADVAVKDGKIVAVGDRRGRGRRGGRRRRPARHAGLRRHPHPLRRPGHLGRRARPVGRPRRHHGGRRATAAWASRRSHPGQEQWLIQLMEGVEDIPGTALTEGMSWDWETFPEYLDVLDGRQYAVDIGTQVAHGAVRGYVMGERGAKNEPATPEDIAAMAAIVAEARRGRRPRLLDLPHPGPPGHGRRAGARHLRRRGRAVRHRPGAGRGRPRRLRAGPRRHRRHGQQRPAQGDRLDAPPVRGDRAPGHASPSSSSTRRPTCGASSWTSSLEAIEDGADLARRSPTGPSACSSASRPTTSSRSGRPTWRLADLPARRAGRRPPGARHRGARSSARRTLRPTRTSSSTASGLPDDDATTLYVMGDPPDYEPTRETVHRGHRRGHRPATRPSCIYDRCSTTTAGAS